MILDTICNLDLEKFLYVLGCARNLVSIRKLDNVGFNFKIGNNVFSLYKHKYYFGYGALIDSLYLFNLDVNFAESLFHVEHGISCKHNSHNDCSTFLWHKRLDHISNEIMLRLVKSEILRQLDLADWDVYVDYIKGKQTRNIPKNPTTRSS